ncbi:hypothetical protein [uncultured Helicobacter sp.]|uniref:hypothetical protein n=1 Tax=uncultured Helicobacter sp. TaxID=175537 RepID=UPI00374F16A5
MAGVLMQRESHISDDDFLVSLRKLCGTDACFQEVLDVIIKFTKSRTFIDNVNIDGLVQRIVYEVREKLHFDLSDFATKDFVKAEIAQLRQEMAEMKQELKQDIADIRVEMSDMKQELKQDIADIRVEMSDMKNSLLKWIFGIGVSSAIVIIGANFALMSFFVSTFRNF